MNSKLKAYSKKLTLQNKTLRRKLGVELQKARVEIGLTQIEVAKKLGYDSAQFISNFERGVCLPPKKTVKTLAKMYKMNFESLVMKYVACEVTMIKNAYLEQFNLGEAG